MNCWKTWSETTYSLPWKFTKPLVPVEVSPALMLWPAPSKAKSMSNLGSFFAPWLWNGPPTLSVIGPLTPSAPLASTSSFTASLPDSIFLSLPLNVSVSSVSTSVSSDASSPPPPPPHAATAKREGGQKGEQDRLQ